MDTFIGIILVLALLLMTNWWWIKKLLFKYQLRSLEKKRLSERVNNVYRKYVGNDYAGFSSSLATLSRSEVYEFQKYLSSVKAGNQLLRKYAQDNGDNSSALYLYGSSLVDEAWKVRGSGSANTVGQDQANLFIIFLQEADVNLRKVLKLSPEYIEVYAPLIRAQMGLGNAMESWSLYKEAKSIEPGRLDYALAMLFQLTEKWGGSHKDMFKFAREQATSGDSEFSAGLIAAAHHEYWQFLESKEGNRYYADKMVKNELLNAIEPVNKLDTEEDYSARYQKMLAQNYVALCFLCMNEKKKARAIFRSIGEHYTPYPWAYMDHLPGAAYLRYRSMAGAGSV